MEYSILFHLVPLASNELNTSLIFVPFMANVKNLGTKLTIVPLWLSPQIIKTLFPEALYVTYCKLEFLFYPYPLVLESMIVST